MSTDGDFPKKLDESAEFAQKMLAEWLPKNPQERYKSKTELRAERDKMLRDCISISAYAKNQHDLNARLSDALKASDNHRSELFGRLFGRLFVARRMLVATNLLWLLVVIGLVVIVMR